MFDRVEAGGIGGQEKQFTARGGHQLLRAGRLVKTGVVQDDHTAAGQRGQQDHFKIRVHHLGVATALKDKRRHQPGVLPNGNDAGAVAAASRDFGIEPFPAGRATIFLIQLTIRSRKSRPYAFITHVCHRLYICKCSMLYTWAVALPLTFTNKKPHCLGQCG